MSLLNSSLQWAKLTRLLHPVLVGDPGLILRETVKCDLPGSGIVSWAGGLEEGKLQHRRKWWDGKGPLRNRKEVGGRLGAERGG